MWICFLILCMHYLLLQTVFENSLMEHRVALPPDAMGKVTYVAPAGQYSLKVCHLNLFSIIYLALFLLKHLS